MVTSRVRPSVWIVAALAAVVVTACGGGDDQSIEEGPGEAHASVLEVSGTDTLDFEPAQLTATAGEVTVELTVEAVNHTFVIEELEDELVVAADPGQPATGTVTLEEGTYTFYCDVPGHREAGMEGTLTVE